MKKFLKKLIVVLLGACIIGGVGFYLYSSTDFFKSMYTVTYDANGGVCEATSVKVEKNHTLQLPETSRTGYDFEGWYFGEDKWTNEKKVTQNMKLVAKWKAQKFDITFIIEGVSYVQKCDYDTIPIFDGTPTKEPTTTIEYVFTGWTPELKKVSGEATYTAQFRAQERKYKILANSNYPGACSITGTGGFSYLTSTTLTVTENKGYIFVGWFKDDVLYSSNKTIPFENIDEDITLEARFEIVTKTINYISEVDVENPNIKQYDIRNGVFELQDLYAIGYTFNGWFTAENGGGIKYSQIDSDSLTDYTLYADWDLIVYTITYDLNGGSVSPENPNQYTIETETFTLNAPTRTDFDFVGWKGTGIKQETKNVTITKGSYGNLKFTAVWMGDAIIFSVDGMFLYDDEIYEDAGAPIQAPDIDEASYGMAGYEVNGWYTDEDCTIPYSFTTMPSDGLILYGTWVYEIGEGFYPYLTKFKAATTSNITDINSYAELVNWVEYLQFYNITEQYRVNLTYPFSGSATVKTELSSAFYDSTFQSSTSVSCSGSGKQGTIYITKSYRDKEATLMCEGYENYTYDQLDYANSVISTSSRTESFDDFRINDIKKELTVSTSTQLVYVLEKGLKPNCVPGSNAERVYNRAKQILRTIVDDDMNDVEKLKAIYDWLIVNVEYDNLALNKSNSINEFEYKAWYAEGVFDHGVAVCAGIADAFLIMAQIERIPTIYVSGNKHAWNKVLVNGAWYGVDATHGNLLVSSLGSEVFTYTSFMFTDSFKTSAGYTGQEYDDVKATTVFNIYDYITIENTSLNLIAATDAEAYQIINAVKESGKTYTIELAFSYDVDINNLFSKLKQNTGVNVSSYLDIGRNTAGDYVYILLVA